VTSVDAGWASLREAVVGLECLRIDAAGRVSPDVGTPLLEHPAEAVCADLDRLVGVAVSPVVVRTLPGGTGGFGGLVTIRETRRGEPVFTTATAVGASEGQALAMATLAAMGSGDDLLTLYASRLGEERGVIAVTVTDAQRVRYRTDDAMAAVHLGLVEALPAPGRLAVATRGAEHRVLCLPAAALVVTVAAGDPLARQLDGALGRIEVAVNEAAATSTRPAPPAPEDHARPGGPAANGPPPPACRA
jgi:hypothetical protein